MSITEELRRYISGPAKSGISHICEKAIANIADRIDESWEREEADFDLMCNKIAAQATCLVEVGEALGVSADQPDSEFFWELAEAARGCIQLPKDADGETIRIGDEVEVIGYEDGTVAAMQLDERRWSVAVRPHGWDTPTAYDAESIRHAKPDSWERIIEDAQADGVRYHNEGKPSDFDALVERCKRLAGEDA